MHGLGLRLHQPPDIARMAGGASGDEGDEGMKDDLVRRQAAITAIQKAYADTEGGADRCAVWKNVGLTNALHIMQDLPSGQTEKMQLSKEDATKGTTFDCISRQAAIKALHDEIVRRRIDEDTNDDGTLDEFDTEAILRRLPSAQPEQIARDIATIIENEQDMRVVLKNAEHTETHSCDYERTGTHDWIPVTERQPNHELAIVQFSDGDFSLLQFPTAYRWKDIVAWFPLPEPYKEGQDEQAD